MDSGIPSLCARKPKQATENIHFLNFYAGTMCLLRRFAWNLLHGGKVPSIPLILIVEDDVLIQTLVEEALQEGGFETAIAPSAEVAVTLIKGRVMNYRALVTDINLQGHMTGWEVARQARQIEPEFPVIYMTGAAARDWTSQGVPNSILLVKPFVPAQLVTAVSQLLIVGTPNG